METEPSLSDVQQSEQFRLAQLAVQGDELAMERLFAEVRIPLRRFIDLRLDGDLRRRIDASDVVQDTLTEASRRLGDYVSRKPMPLRVWLLKLGMKQLGHARVKHLARQIRSVKREQRLPDESAWALARAFAEHSTPSRVAMKRERDRKLATLIGRLEDSDRNILLLRHVEDFNYAEIAELLDVSASTARQQYVRALTHLKQFCVQGGLDGDVL